MARGRKPQPPELLQLAGSRHVPKRGRQKGRRGAGAATVPPRGAPNWLDAVGKAKWRELHALLTAHGVIDKTDTGLLARYCSTWSRWRAAMAAIREHGEVYSFTDKNGNLQWKRHHESRIASELLRALSDMEQQMGLTPMSRPRIPSNPIGESGSGPPKRNQGLQKYVGGDDEQ